MKEPTNSRGFAKESRKPGKGISGQNEHNVSEWILFDSVYSVISASSVVKNNFAT
jgi:hypothetical protein